MLGGVQGTGESPTTWRTSLPYAGRLLRVEAQEAGDVTARLYDASGAQLRPALVDTLDAGEGMYVELVEGVHELGVTTSGARPRAYLDQDAIAVMLVEETSSSVRLRVYGTDAAFERQPIDDLTFKGTTYSGMPTQVAMPPQAQRYLHTTGSASLYLTLQA
jgi:hypothetical protein